jgi:hypothetical protein
MISAPLILSFTRMDARAAADADLVMSAMHGTRATP